MPELSFGTHFFQDLVESAIRYLPLFPGEDGVVLNLAFLSAAANQFAALVPEYAGSRPRDPRDRRLRRHRRPGAQGRDERG